MGSPAYILLAYHSGCYLGWGLGFWGGGYGGLFGRGGGGGFGGTGGASNFLLAAAPGWGVCA